jgi:hypothetical protein
MEHSASMIQLLTGLNAALVLELQGAGIFQMYYIQPFVSDYTPDDNILRPCTRHFVHISVFMSPISLSV